jgi:DNA-binding transcriptional ArsR family regulator
MARAPTTTDVFNAIAEPQRRQIIGLLRDREEWTVGEIASRMKIAQPAASKHLHVLKEVGVVTVTRRGRLRCYRLHPASLKPLFEWVVRANSELARAHAAAHSGSVTKLGEPK